jgi:hypothetical protein
MFSRHPTRRRQWWCRGCFREYFRIRGEAHRRQSYAAKQRRRAQARAYIDSYLATHPCTDCGERDVLVLEFDHVGRKEAGLSVLIADGWSEKRIIREIKACQVVCVNCHRRRTARRWSSWRTNPSKIETDPHLLPGERRNMALIRDLLREGACVDCGLKDLLVLEFDHIGQKRHRVTVLARRGCSLATLEAEIAQCEIRCANCHRRRTRSMRGGEAKAA